MAAPNSQSQPERKLSEVAEVLRTVKEISDLLNTGLDDATLKLCVQLLEAGVNAEALASVVMELRREMAAFKEEEQSTLIER